MYRHGKAESEMARKAIDSGSWFRYYGKEEHLGFASEFERRIAEHTGAKYVLATSSGTGALVSSLAALGIGPQDEVIVPAYTFIASAAAVIAVGAVPVIAEIDETLTIDPNDMEQKISPRTRAVMPVHMLGYPCDMDAIMAIADKHGIQVLEDAAQSVGGQYKSRPLGTIGHMGAYSFQWHKMISTGEGGCVLTDSPELHERASIYHDDAHCFRGIDQGIPAFPGVNYRMSEIAAAVGCAQVDRLAGIVRDMRAVKGRVIDQIGDIGPYEVVRSHDQDGECGWMITIRAPDRGHADRFSLESDTGSILDTKKTNWHIYYHWDYILEKRSVAGRGFPWCVGDWVSPVEYSKDMCPKSLDILPRCFNFGTNPDWTDAEVSDLAAKIRDAAT